MQGNLETPTVGGRGETVPCNRGILEDGTWFLVVDRDPIAEGHCKLICKEHVSDMLELADWSHRDQKMAHVRDTLATLGRMPLGPGDVVYVSPFVESSDSEYARRARAEGVVALDDAAREAQAAMLRDRVRRRLRGVQAARYDIREFVY